MPSSNKEDPFFIRKKEGRIEVEGQSLLKLLY